MVENRSIRALAIEVPVEVVGEVTYGVLVRFCEVCNLKVILIVEVVDSLHNQLARVALLHILRDV